MDTFTHGDPPSDIWQREGLNGVPEIVITPELTTLTVEVERIPTMTPMELAELLSQYGAVCAWVAQLLTSYRPKAKYLRITHDKALARAVGKRRGELKGRPTKEEVYALVEEQDEELRLEGQDLAETQAMQERLETQLEQFNIMREMVSRIITVRSLEQGRGQQTGGF